MYTRPHYFLCMHVQTKHNVEIQIQKLTKQNLMHVLQMNRNDNSFKLTSLCRLGSFYW
jgi:hypothetical protein